MQVIARLHNTRRTHKLSSALLCSNTFVDADSSKHSWQYCSNSLRRSSIFAIGQTCEWSFWECHGCFAIHSHSGIQSRVCKMHMHNFEIAREPLLNFEITQRRCAISKLSRNLEIFKIVQIYKMRGTYICMCSFRYKQVRTNQAMEELNKTSVVIYCIKRFCLTIQ